MQTLTPKDPNLQFCTCGAARVAHNLVMYDKISFSEIADETIQKKVRSIFTVDDADFKEKIFGFPPIPFKVKTKKLLKNYLDTRRINEILNDFSLI